jgi:hypothetical protein
MDTTQVPNAEALKEFVFTVPDEIHQVLLIEVARGLGLRAFIRPRAKRRVWVCGSKTEADAVATTARQLAEQLQALQLKALDEVLMKNGLRPSPSLLKLVAMAESKMAAARAHPPVSRGEPATISERDPSESNSH